MTDSAHSPLALRRDYGHFTRTGLSGHLTDARNRLVAQILDWKTRTGAAFWRLADKRVPKEWLVFAFGGFVLLVYVFVLFFGTRPRK